MQAGQALRAVDWEDWKCRARDFFRAHPSVPGSSLTHAQRLLCSGAKEAFAVSTRARNTEAVALGGQPCSACGCWTCSWCEGCDSKRDPPYTAVCTFCDGQKLLCSACQADGFLYSEVERKADRDVIEISGYHEGDSFVRIEPPIRVPLSEMPVTADGSYDVDAFLSHLGSK